MSRLCCFCYQAYSLLGANFDPLVW